MVSFSFKGTTLVQIPLKYPLLSSSVPNLLLNNNNLTAFGYFYVVVYLASFMVLYSAL
jgi:hypothetical protein